VRAEAIHQAKGVSVPRRSLAIFAFVLFASGCVSKGTYDAAVESANRAQVEDRARSSTLQAQLATLTKHAVDLQQQLDAATAAAQADVARLRHEEAAIEARSALFHDLARKLAKMVDAGDLRIVLRDGRMVLQLPNDVLFDTGKTEIKPAGRIALTNVAAILQTVPGHNFQVAGDTDNVPIATHQFPSNWELSSARALGVVHLLKEGMAPSKLSGAGYGEFDPVAANDSPAGKAKNRRTEITLQPNIDELVAMPQSP